MGSALVHRVEVRGGVLVALTAGQEHDAGHRGRHPGGEALEGLVGDLVDRRLHRCVVSRQHHVGLEEAARQVDPLLVEGVVQRLEGGGADHPGAFDGVITLHHHLGFDDRDDADLLAERRVPRERVGVDVDRVLRRKRVGDGVGGAPLGEPGAEAVVLGEPVAQPVEALGDRLPVVGEGERLGAGVDLDAGDDTLALEDLGERGAVEGRLADRLVEEDDAADVVADPFGREQEVAVRAPVVLGVFDADRVEALLDGAGALVGGEDALAGRDERPGGRFEGVGVHRVHSHSMVPGGLLVMSYATRLTPGTSLMIRDAMRSSTSCGSRAQSAVIASSDVTARTTIGYS